MARPRLFSCVERSDDAPLVVEGASSKGSSCRRPMAAGMGSESSAAANGKGGSRRRTLQRQREEIRVGDFQGTAASSAASLASRASTSRGGSDLVLDSSQMGRLPSSRLRVLAVSEGPRFDREKGSSVAVANPCRADRPPIQWESPGLSRPFAARIRNRAPAQPAAGRRGLRICRESYDAVWLQRGLRWLLPAFRSETLPPGEIRVACFCRA